MHSSSLTLIKSRLYLHAIFPQLALVCTADSEARSLVAGWRTSIEFRQLGGPAARISFDRGDCRFDPAPRGIPGLGLLLLGADHTVKLFGDGQTKPLPWAGMWRASLMRCLPLLTRRLQAYLGNQGQTTDPALAARVRVMILVRAVSVLSRWHEPTRAMLAEAPDGVIEIEVPGAVTVQARKAGLEVSLLEGIAVPANVRLVFADPQLALGVLSGTADIWTALGTGEFRIQGLVPLAEAVFDAMDDVKQLLGV